MNIYIVCAWYEVAMRHYSFTILNNIKKYLPAEYKINVTLVLRNHPENYPELTELEGMNIDYLIIKNNYVNIASKAFPVFFDNYVAKKAKEYNASLMYILFEGLFFKDIRKIQKNCKVLFTVHDLIPHEKNISNWKEKWLSVTETKRGLYLREHADYTITNSHEQYIELKTTYAKPAFYTCMPTLINDHIADGTMKPKELNINNYILFFGRIDKYKGLDQLVECHLNSNVEATLVIAGAGNLWFEIPDTPRVLFINKYIDDKEFKYLFENALVCVLPYKAITQTSLVSLPYYFNCPVMLSDIAEFKLLSKESGSIICNFKNPDQYGSSIKNMQNTGLKHIVTSAQTKYYKENYNPQVFISHLKGIFDEIQKTT